jgi:hypothetical protein
MRKVPFSVVAAGCAIGLTALTFLLISVFAPTLFDWLASLPREQLNLFRAGCAVVTVLILVILAARHRRAGISTSEP